MLPPRRCGGPGSYDVNRPGLSPYGAIGGPSRSNLTLPERLSGHLHPARKRDLARVVEIWDQPEHRDEYLELRRKLGFATTT
jgi:hypothetical protein